MTDGNMGWLTESRTEPVEEPELTCGKGIYEEILLNVSCLLGLNQHANMLILNRYIGRCNVDHVYSLSG